MINRNKHRSFPWLKQCFFIVLCWGWVILAGASVENTYQFATPAQQQMFEELTQEFRCLVCQNESLADSNAALAQDLRQQIATLVQQGTTKQQIKHYLVQRYGDFILFKPPLKKITYLLWFGPFLLIIGSVLILLVIIKIKQHKLSATALKLTPAEQQRLHSLLAKQQD